MWGQGVKPGFFEAVHGTVTKITPSLHQVGQFITLVFPKMVHLIDVVVRASCAALINSACRVCLFALTK